MARFTAVPDYDDLQRFYPEAAMRGNVEARTQVRCAVDADGALTDCVVTREEPAGFGFGVAALKAAALFRAQPKLVDGRPVAGGWTVVNMAWRLPHEPPPAVLSAPR